MGTKRTIEREGLLSVEIEGVDVEGVHFTDQQFEYDLVCQNLSDEHLTGSIELQNHLETTLGDYERPIFRREIDLDLPRGESHRETVQVVGMVGGAGTAVIGGTAQPVVADEDAGHIEVAPGEAFLPLFSTVFWDREFYRANYLWPRRAQYLSVVFALLSVILVGMVVLLNVG